MKTILRYGNKYLVCNISANKEFNLNVSYNNLTDLYLISEVKREHCINQDLIEAINNRFLPNDIEFTVACGVMIIHLINPEYI